MMNTKKEKYQPSEKVKNLIKSRKKEKEQKRKLLNQKSEQ